MQDAADVRSVVLHCTTDTKSGSADIFISDPKSGKRMNLTKGRATDSNWNQPWGPVGAPDGKAVIFYQFNHSSGTMVQRNWLLEIDEGKLHQLPDPSQHSWNFTWAPKSGAVAYPQGGSIAVLDRKTLKITQIAVWKDKEIEALAWSPDGKWIACGGKRGSFRLISPDGNTQKRIVCQGLDASNFVWSPTGERLAALVKGELSIISLDGDIVKRFGKASSVCSWSSDGQYIAYAQRDTNARHLWIQGVSDGKSVPVDISGDCYAAVWKPHSERLAFWHKAGLMTVGPDGKNPLLFGKNYRGSTMPPSWLVTK